MTVYLDLAFLQGFFLHGATFWIAVRVIGLKASGIRLTVASLLCAVTSVLILLPSVPILLTVLGGVASCVIVFGKKSLRGTLRNSILCLLLLVLVLGFRTVLTAAFGCLSVTFLRGNAYLLASFFAQVLSTAASIAVIYAVLVYARRKRRSPACVDCRIELDGMKIPIRCYPDTGNLLTDPARNTPVVIVEYDYLLRTYDAALPRPLTYAFAERFGRRCGVIRYRGVSGEGRMLSTVVADAFWIEGRRFDVTLALTEDRLEYNGCYYGIVGPSLWKGEEDGTDSSA